MSWRPLRDRSETSHLAPLQSLTILSRAPQCQFLPSSRPQCSSAGVTSLPAWLWTLFPVSFPLLPLVMKSIRSWTGLMALWKRYHFPLYLAATCDHVTNSSSVGWEGKLRAQLLGCTLKGRRHVLHLPPPIPASWRGLQWRTNG